MVDLNVADDYWLPERLAKLSVFIELERGTFNHYLDMVSSWLDVVRNPTLAGNRIRPEAVLTGNRVWRAALDRFTNRAIIPALGAAFDEQFDEGYPFTHRPYVARHLATVTNRLVSVPEEVFNDIRLDLADAAGRGESIPEIADRIRGTLLNAGSQVWRNRATVVARTETVSAYNAGSNDAFQAVEEALDIPMEKVWLATDDDRTRPTHKHADGQRVPLDDKFTVGGFKLEFPGDPTGPAQEIIQCRCTMLLVEPGEELGTALTSAALPLEWAFYDGFDHAGCFLEFCRNPLHPGPCKGWKHTLNKVAPGAYRALEQARVDKLNEKRKAKIKALQDAGKPVPKSLLKPITVGPPGGPVPANLAEAGTQAPLSKATEANLAKVAKKTADAFDPKVIAEKKAAARKKAKELAAAKKAAEAPPPDAPQVGVPPVQDTDNKPAPFVPTDEQSAAIAVTEAGSDLNPVDAVAALNDLSSDDFAELPPDVKAEIIGELAKLAHNPKLSALERGQAAAKHKELTGNLPPAPAKKAAPTMAPAKKAAPPAPAPEVPDTDPSTGPADVPASVATPAAQKAADVAKNPKGTPLKDRLAAYEALTQEDIDSLSVDDVAAIQKDLDAVQKWYEKKNLKTGAKKVADLKANVQNKIDQQGPAPAPAKATKAAKKAAPKKSAPPDPGLLVPTGQTLGTHGAEVYEDENGQKWLIKKQEAFLNQADVGAARLAAAAGVPTAEVHEIELNGQLVSAQRMIPSKPAFGGSKKVKPANLTPQQVLELQKAQVLDWLTSNHDSHGGQFIEDENGNLVPIDKTQSFKHFGNDQLDPNYHPNAAYGEEEPVYNQMWKAYANGDAIDMNDPNSGELGAFIQQVQNIPDDELRDMFRPYAEAAQAAGKLSTGDVDKFLDAVVERKNNLAKDFGKLHADQQAKRQAKLGTPAKSTPAPTKTTPAAPPAKKTASAPVYNKYQQEAVGVTQGGFVPDATKYKAIAQLSKEEFGQLDAEDQKAVRAAMVALGNPGSTLNPGGQKIIRDLYKEWTGDSFPSTTSTSSTTAPPDTEAPTLPTPPKDTFKTWQDAKKKLKDKVNHPPGEAVLAQTVAHGVVQDRILAYQKVATPTAFDKLSPDLQNAILADLDNIALAPGGNFTGQQQIQAQALRMALTGTTVGTPHTPAPNTAGIPKQFKSKAAELAHHAANNPNLHPTSERVAIYKKLSKTAFQALPPETQKKIVEDLANIAEGFGGASIPQQHAAAQQYVALTGKNMYDANGDPTYYDFTPVTPGAKKAAAKKAPAKKAAKKAAPGTSTAPTATPAEWDDRVANAQHDYDALNAIPYGQLDTGYSIETERNIAFAPTTNGISGISMANAIASYRAGSYNINSALRSAQGGPLPSSTYPETRNEIEALDAAMLVSRTGQDAVMWRGFRGQPVFGSRMDGDMTGIEFVEDAYASTSAHRATSVSFAGNYRGVLMRVLIPAGTGGVQVSGQEYESELLLERGLRMRIVRDNGTNSQGLRLLDAEVVPA